MKFKEIKEKNIGDLKTLITEKKEAIRIERFGASGSKSKNVKAIKNSKKDIARILTLLNARKIENVKK